VTQFRAQLRALLAGHTFLPHGGLLGFGLQHQYALAGRPSGAFADVFAGLRGVDAAVRRACTEHGLMAAGKLFLECDFDDDGWLLDALPELHDVYDDNFDQHPHDDYGGKYCGPGEHCTIDPDQLVWITAVEDVSRTEKHTYGVIAGHKVSRLVLQVRVAWMTTGLLVLDERVLRQSVSGRGSGQAWLP
jgi:hypothetical protein